MSNWSGLRGFGWHVPTQLRTSAAKLSSRTRGAVRAASPLDPGPERVQDALRIPLVPFLVGRAPTCERAVVAYRVSMAGGTEEKVSRDLQGLRTQCLVRRMSVRTVLSDLGDAMNKRLGRQSCCKTIVI